MFHAPRIFLQALVLHRTSRASPHRFFRFWNWLRRGFRILFDPSIRYQLLYCLLNRRNFLPDRFSAVTGGSMISVFPFWSLLSAELVETCTTGFFLLRYDSRILYFGTVSTWEIRLLSVPTLATLTASFVLHISQRWQLPTLPLSLAHCDGGGVKPHKVAFTFCRKDQSPHTESKMRAVAFQSVDQVDVSDDFLSVGVILELPYAGLEKRSFRENVVRNHPGLM